MQTAAKFYWAIVIAFVFFTAGVVSSFAASPGGINLPDSGAYILADDQDEAPEVTSRVARISFIRGEARIRRAGGDDWEKATLNLPIVEGDEILTETGSRVEIQFGVYKHLRLEENSLLKIAGLKDEGIAVSISLGTLNLRITSFDRDKNYFEIDAPKTTVAIQRAGTYRVDAGRAGDTEIRVAATDGGEARVYSETSGFTLKNGRSSRIFIDGPKAGESETVAASRLIDEFDEWAADRDSTIAQRLRDAHYDRYYDQDIYGAEDLSDHGAWVHTVDYGYVWRPHRTTISRYVDWSPYRYGHWRWMPPYGWIWVNDEPWGWATYHYGRWFWHDGYWNWSPYGYYRTSRSWWRPALVVINIFNDNVCWYPLGYRHRYYNYNGRRDRRNNNAPVIVPTPTPTVPNVARNPRRQPLDVIPPSGVVSVTRDDFGTRSKGPRTVSPVVARDVLAGKGDGRSPLPVYTDVRTKVTGDIRTDRPRLEVNEIQARAGAAPRKSGTALDGELRTTRVFGGRAPLVIDNGSSMPTTDTRTEPRQTGAVERPPVVKSPDAPVVREPQYTPPPQRDVPREKAPRYEPPPVRDVPRYEPPARTEKPRNDPPPAREPQRSPAPQKSEPKQDNPPPARAPERGKKPDGR